MEEEKKKLFFCSYFRHISLFFYSNFDRESYLDAELNFASNEHPLDILLMGPATRKTRNTWKTWWWHHHHIFFQVFLIFWVAGSVKSIPSGTSCTRNLILHPTSSPDRILSKNIERYAENTNKKVNFFLFFLQN